MTKEEFLNGCQEAVDQANDPRSEFRCMVSEGRATADELTQYDPILAQHVRNVADSIEAMLEYAKTRAEN